MAPNTPLALALWDLFRGLDTALRAAGAPAASVRAYVFGGAAVHLHTRVRVSDDVDVEFETHGLGQRQVVLLASQLPPVEFDDPELGSLTLVYDATFNTTLGPLHEDYQDRAACIQSFGDDAPLSLWLPSAEDLAITKLGRFADHDIADILALLRGPQASVECFERLATEVANYYPAPAGDLASKLEYIRGRLRQSP